MLNCIFCENYKKGVFLIDFMGNMIIDVIIIICNGVGGMIVEWVFGIFIVINSYFINNSVNGLKILDSSFLLFNLYGLFSK